MTFLYLADPARGAIMRQIFAQEAPDIAFRMAGEAGDDRAVRYVATWTAPDDLAQRHPALDILFSTGAGVDQFDMASLPSQASLVRLIDRNLSDGMVEYVCGAVLALHRDFPAYAQAQRQACWHERPVLPACARRVSILGAGEMGRAVITALARFGFPLAAWSRSPRQLPGATHYSGQDGLERMLATTDILICLLPLTAETIGILCRDLFDNLPQGASLINVGRGRHLVESDLLAALDSGHLSQAILDVTHPEPLPRDHAFWAHPRIFLTPHVASVTDPAAAARAMIANIRRHARGLPLEGIVQRGAGY